MKAAIYSVLFTLTRAHSLSHAADSGKKTTFRGTHLWWPHVQATLNIWGLDFDRLKLCFTSKILYAGCTDLSVVISAQFAPVMCVTARNCQKKSIKPLFWHSGSSKVIDFSAKNSQKPMYDFLLVINSNLGPISHCFWDMMTYWPKIVNFSYPLSFSALLGVISVEFMESLYGSWN